MSFMGILTTILSAPYSQYGVIWSEALTKVPHIGNEIPADDFWETHSGYGSSVMTEREHKSGLQASGLTECSLHEQGRGLSSHLKGKEILTTNGWTWETLH